MSEIGDDFEAMREDSAAKREKNRKKSAQILRDKNIRFITNNGGAHLIVMYSAYRVDFWPGTGKFIFRDDGRKGRGVFNLIRLLTEEG